MNDFERAFSIIIGQEGGYSDNPHDPGGETKYGISKRAYPDLDIKNLTLYQAKGIYYEDYWAHIHGDELTWPLNCFVFDSAVNQGVHKATVLLQQALQTSADGIIGPITLTLANKASTWNLARFMYLRLSEYQKNANFVRFGEGWTMRLFQVMLNSAT